MTTIKSYSDLQQSKKLAEFLPLESADMRYAPFGDIHPWVWEGTFIERDAVPCWSLAALLSIINNIKGWYPGIDAQVEDNKWQICMFSRETGSNIDLSSINEELIDVCYEVIVKLHDKKLI